MLMTPAPAVRFDSSRLPRGGVLSHIPARSTNREQIQHRGFQSVSKHGVRAAGAPAAPGRAFLLPIGQLTLGQHRTRVAIVVSDQNEAV